MMKKLGMSREDEEKLLQALLVAQDALGRTVVAALRYLRARGALYDAVLIEEVWKETLAEAAKIKKKGA